MTSNEGQDRRDDAENAAAAWDARLRRADVTDSDRLDFENWLSREPENHAAYDTLQGLLASLRLHADTPELRAMRDEARQGGRLGVTRRRGVIGMVAAAGLAAVIGMGMLTPAGSDVMVQLTGGQVYRTHIGERAKVTLADGSVLTLDSGTRLATYMSATRRDVRIKSGQALFQVAKNPARPFVVHAGPRMVTALGTIFDVRLDRGRMRVTLVEGKVAVHLARTPDSAPPTILTPRQQLVETPGQVPQVRIVDTDRTLGWTEGRILFEDEPLSVAVDEMNRYARNPIVIADPAIGDLRINGMLRTENVTGFLGALQTTLPVEVRTDDRGRTLITGRPDLAHAGS